MRVLMVLLVGVMSCGRTSLIDATAQRLAWTFDDPRAYAFDPASVVIADSTARPKAIVQSDGSDRAFAGTLIGVASVDASGALELGGATGTYLSQVFDAPNASPWTSLTLVPDHPVGVPLPASSETQYRNGNISREALQLLFHMDETTGLLRDSSGHGFDATAEADMDSASGIFSDALTLENGASATVADTPELIAREALTVTAWVRVKSLDTRGFIVSKETELDAQHVPGWCLYITVTAQVDFCTGDGTTVMANTISNEKVAMDTWHFIAATHVPGAQRIYIDGALATLLLGGSHAFTLGDTTGVPVLIGRRYSDDDFLHGDIDELAVWHRELDADAIAYLYRRGSQRLTAKVRSCTTPTCDDAVLVGPDGSPATSYVFGQNLTRDGFPVVDLAIPPNPYFQYELTLGSPVGHTVQITEARVGPERSRGVVDVSAIEAAPYRSLVGFEETRVGTGSIAYQLSPNGQDWYWHDGDTWSPATNTSMANSAATLATAVTTFAHDVGPGAVRWKALFVDDGEPELSSVIIDAIQ